MGRVRRCRVVVSCVLVALLLDLTGCSAWKQVAWQDNNYTQVRAHLADGSVVTLRDPWFESDTLHGWREARVKTSADMPEIYGRPQAHPTRPAGSNTKHAGYDSTAIALTQVTKLEALTPDKNATAFAVVGVIVAVVVMAVVALNSGLSDVGNLGGYAQQAGAERHRDPAPRP